MNLRASLWAVALPGLFFWIGACGGDDDDTAIDDDTQSSAGVGEGDGGADTGDEDTGSESSEEGADTSNTPADSDGDTGLGIGSPCTCQGSGCAQVGVPVPNGGNIEGCDEVPTDIAGAELVCLRSYKGTMATNTYFADGYCALMASTCQGDPVVCGKATFGDYDAMTVCPKGTVMITASRDVEVDLGVGKLEAKIDNKMCAASCEDGSECRDDAFDDVLDEPTQYTCNRESGVNYCYDPRNLEQGEHSVQQF